MATYDYRCKDCGAIQEEQHSMKEQPEVVCENCNSSNTYKYLGNSSFLVNYVGAGWTRKEQAMNAAGIPPEVAKTAEGLGRL